MIRLIDLREDKDLTQEKVSKLLGIDRSQYSKLELGVYRMKSDKLIILSDFYNTSIDYILGLTNNIIPYKRIETFNNNLKKLRLSKKLNSLDVAHHLNISQPQYSSLENSKSLLTHDKLITLSKFYNTSVDYILGLTNENKPYSKSTFEIK